MQNTFRVAFYEHYKNFYAFLYIAIVAKARWYYIYLHIAGWPISVRSLWGADTYGNQNEIRKMSWILRCFLG